MSKTGYIRLSTLDQNTDRQVIALSNLGIEKFFTEKVSGKNTDRPQLKKMLEYVREGDTLYIESISRLARSIRDLLYIVQQLQDKKVDLVSLKENIDTSTPQGRFMLTIFGALSELERENTLERQREGIEAARLKGKKLGRPRVEKPEEWNKVISLWKKGEITAVDAMEKLNLNRGTFYRRVKKETDNAFTSNQYVRIEKGEPIISKPEKKKTPEELKLIQAVMFERLQPINILDVLTDTQYWLNWAKYFGSISGHDAKLDNPIERYLITACC
ncbi:recombinase family protein [Anaerosolibacter sp.]|uniref:recombinase family protein n=1 Tax=Anaerosolibacter sp. TaxID=1872527 RepID=UPI0039EE52BC